ncbi:MAG: pentapeptide repeat-containing protein [Proteobacteria bacterium]|nr:pentapeptide repeat-containing protein [Pseudomonadota bacterium]
MLKDLYPEQRRKVTQQELNGFLLAHERHLTYQHGGAKAELARTKLDRLNLANRNLAEADFSYASLVGASLFGSTLDRANFLCADLRDSDLRSTKLVCANLRGASIRGAKLAFAKLDGADLRAATVAYRGPEAAASPERTVPVDFSNASLKGVSFGHAQLEGANFSGAILEDVNFKNAKLANVTFRNAVLVGVDVVALGLPPEALEGCVVGVTAEAVAKAAVIKEKLEAHWLCVSSGANKGAPAILDGEDLRVVKDQFAGKPLTGLAARRVCAVGIDFSGSQLQGVRFDGADLRECNFNRADIRGCSFRDCKLGHATFEKADMRSLVAGGRQLAVDLTGASASRSQFSLSVLETDLASLGLEIPLAAAA